MVEDPSVKEDDEDRISEEDTGVDVSSVRVSETESPTEVCSLIFDLLQTYSLQMPSLHANSREEEYI